MDRSLFLAFRRWRQPLAVALVALVCGPPALALEAALPVGAERTAARSEGLASYALPIGPWADGSMLTQRTEGRVDQIAWRVAAPGIGTLELMSPLRAALLAEGWQVVFDCETESCGGFDFRYSTQVLPEPAMHVDLGDFRFLSARRGGDEFLSLLVSRSTGAGTGHVQMIRVGPQSGAAPLVAVSTKSEPYQTAGPAQGLAAALDQGAVVLEGVVFDSGAADQAKGGDTALAELAAYLAAHPDRSIALVGHTDASGSLEANAALSKRRAEAVRQRLIRELGADGKRIIALGAGFMAPRASNLTEEGRAANRRVEAIVTSTR